MSENARGKGRKRALGSIGSRQMPSIVQPSGVNIDELTDLEELQPGTAAAAPQMGQDTANTNEQAPPTPRRRQQA